MTSNISPFKTPERFNELRASSSPSSDDSLSDILKISTMDSKHRKAFVKLVPDMATFVTLDEAIVSEIVSELSTDFPDAPFAKTSITQRIQVKRLLRLIRFIVLGGSVSTKPTAIEIEAYIASVDKGLLGASLSFPDLTNDSSLSLSSSKYPPNGSKLSEALTSWDGGHTLWFDWKDVTLIKMGQFPEFKAVLENETKATADSARSSILYSILLEKTLGGDAHTLLTSLPLEEQTGYHGWQKLHSSMEGSEKGPLLEKEATRLLKIRKDSNTTLLAFQGDMERAFQLLVHAKKPLDEDMKMNYVFTRISDPDFQSLVSQLQREKRSKTLTSIEKLWSELREHETSIESKDNVDTAEILSIWRTEHKSPGSDTNKGT